MKLFKFLGLIVLSASLTLTSCDKDEESGTCIDGIQNQGETGIDCGGPCEACLIGAHGKWKSYPVAPILATFTDSIIAEFHTNSTYTVQQWKDGVKVDLSGTYTQTESNNGEIWNIQLNQSSPSTLTAQGIFEVSADGNTMKYEVAQTDPAVAGVTAPTAEGGFGSTSGGAFGDVNIQNYTRLEK